jgi:peptidoglycan/LPS O-acetylase OafA/YrhL
VGRAELSEVATSPVRGDLQGLRGFAVLVVVLYHADLPMVAGGFVGVDVFFVLSGYLITRMLVEDLRLRGRVDYVGFMSRRTRRLLPASMVALAATVLLTIWYYPPIERDEILGAARASSLQVSNLWFTLRAVDYFGGHAASNPLLHMWSLGVEWQFYVVWPLVVAGAAAWWPRAQLHLGLTGMAGGIGLLSLLACLLLTQVSQPWAFFGMPTRAWEFVLGGLVWLHADRWRRLPAAVSALMAAFGALALSFAALLMNDGLLFPGLWAVVPAGGCALLLAGLEGSGAGWMRRALGQKAMVRMGDVSYAWYLVHWPILAALAAWSPRPDPAATVVAILVSWVLAVGLHRFVEVPFRRSSPSAPPPRVILLFALCTGIAAAAVVTGMRMHLAAAPIDATQARYAAARLDISPVYARGCHVDIPAVQAVLCEGGLPTSVRTVVLFGDSHAAHWFPALERLAKESGWRLLSITKSGCPAVGVTVVNATLRRDYVECDRWREDALRRIRDLKPDLVVISNSGTKRFPAPLWEAGMRRTLQALEEVGARRLVVLRDTPAPGFDVPVCLARAAYRGQSPELACGVRVETALAPGLALADAERRAVAAFPGGRWVDMTQEICPGGRCAAETGSGIVVFSDASHLSARRSEALAGPLREAMGDWAPR